MTEKHNPNPFDHMPAGFLADPLKAIDAIAAEPGTQAWLDQQKATVRELIKTAVESKLAQIEGDDEKFLDNCMCAAQMTAALDRTQMLAAFAVAIDMLAVHFLLDTNGAKP